MDYQTFKAAHSHNFRHESHLINLIQTRVNRIPSFSLFIGAGASFSSGIPTASSMMNEWRRRIFAAEKPEMMFAEWLNLQDWYNSEEEYSKLFELVYDQPIQRRTYIERVIDKKPPGWGYAYLTSLIEKNVFNTIFTTNFDDLVNEACYRYSTNLRPMVCAHDSAVTSIRMTSDRPKVIKLHGDFLYDSIKNTTTELQALEINMRDKLIEFAKEFGMIFVGYSGSDKSVMDVMDSLVRSKQFFQHGIYWCIRKGSVPGKRLRNLLRHDRVFWVEIDGFDDFMAELASSLSIRLPNGIINPHHAMTNYIKHLVGDNELEPQSPIILSAKSNLNERMNKILRSLEDNGLSQSDRGIVFSSAVDALQNDLIPFLTAISHSHSGDHESAANELILYMERTNYQNIDESISTLFKSLIRCSEMHGKIIDVVNNITSSSHTSSEIYMLCGYYSLFANHSQLALDLSDKSLELNPAMIPAKINKAIALIQLEQDYNSIAVELTQDPQRHFQAAGWALLGDAKKMSTSLQEAIASNKYSVSEALKDVVFRPYWGEDFFTKVLRPFSDKPIVYELLECCPPSEPEIRLKEQALAAAQDSTVH